MSCLMFKIKSKKVAVSHKARKADARVSAYYEPSPVDVFLFRKHKTPNNAEESIRCTSDVYMLFNQMRLNSLTRKADKASDFGVILSK